MDYQVKFEHFEGPFDLLLELVSKERVDIYEVPVSKIVHDYVEYIREASLDLEVTSEFLVLATTLLYLKARRLLPDEEEETESPANDGRDELIARLLEYHKFKGAAEVLSGRFASEAGAFPRMADIEERFTGLMPDFSEGLEVGQIGDVARQLLMAEPVSLVEANHILPAPLKLDSYLDAVMNSVLEGPVSYRALITDSDKKDEMIAYFLAILELYHQGKVLMDQDNVFGEIKVGLKKDGTKKSGGSHKVN